jgi:hypothetical protein
MNALICTLRYVDRQTASLLVHHLTSPMQPACLRLVTLNH